MPHLPTSVFSSSSLPIFTWVRDPGRVPYRPDYAGLEPFGYFLCHYLALLKEKYPSLLADRGDSWVGIESVFNDPSWNTRHPEVSSVVPSTNKLFETPHQPSFFQLLVNCLDHDISSFLLQCTPSSLWQVSFPDAGYGSLWVGDWYRISTKRQKQGKNQTKSSTGL
ncbi:hypothetical protein Tco_0642238 [Tanacetum coccineum]